MVLSFEDLFDRTFQTFVKPSTWLAKLHRDHKAYIRSLTTFDRRILELYSDGWDADLAGVSKRRNKIQIGHAETGMEEARARLRDLIANAPKLTDNITLLAGISDRAKAKKRGVWSASFDPTIAAHYASRMNIGVNKRDKFYAVVQVRKGTPIIYMEPVTGYRGEYECILLAEHLIYLGRFERTPWGRVASAHFQAPMSEDEQKAREKRNRNAERRIEQIIAQGR